MTEDLWEVRRLIEGNGCKPVPFLGFYKIKAIIIKLLS